VKKDLEEVENEVSRIENILVRLRKIYFSVSLRLAQIQPWFSALQSGLYVYNNAGPIIAILYYFGKKFLVPVIVGGIIAL